MTQINSHVIKISGGAELAEGLEFGKDYKLSLDGSVTSTRDKDNHDGTIDRTYTVKLLNAIVKDEKKSIVVKDKHGQSQLTRGAIYHLHTDTGSTMNEEDFYIYVHKMIRANLREIYEKYKL